MSADTLWNDFLRAFSEARDTDAQKILAQVHDDPAFARLLLKKNLAGASEKLLKQRQDILDRVAAVDASIKTDIAAFLTPDERHNLTRAQFVATTPLPEWGMPLVAFIQAKVDRFGFRAELFETTISIHWAINQLCRFVLDEQKLFWLFWVLDQLGGYMNWLMPEMSQAKAVLDNERLQLRKQLLAQAVQSYREKRIATLESFVRHDTDGMLLPLIRERLKQMPPTHIDGLAVLFHAHALTNQENNFRDSLARSDSRVFLPHAGETLLLCGDTLFASLCIPAAEVEDFADKPLALGFVIDINFPREQLANPVYIASRVPSFIRELLPSGKAKLILSAAGEISFFSPIWLEWLRGLAAHFGCPMCHFIYVAQNAAFVDLSNRYRAENNLSDAPHTVAANTHLLLASLRVEAKEPVAPTKKFLCFNNSPSLHRAALLLALSRDGLLDEFHYSFNQKLNGEYNGETLAPWLGQSVAKTEKLLAQTEARLPIRLDLSNLTVGSAGGGEHTNSFNADLHADAVFYLVTETEMADDAVRRFTEKTVKGFATLMPFIVLGSWRTLASLRDLGFKTFAPVIDESYDEIVEPIERFHRAYAEIRRLHALPLPKLMKMREQLREVVVYNRQHLMKIADVLRERFGRCDPEFP